MAPVPGRRHLFPDVLCESPTMSRTSLPSAHPDDPHYLNRSGWLRAAVLGANDGSVSVSSLIVGVAAANPDPTAVMIAGAAGLAAGAMSMAAGEYVSMRSQREFYEYQIDLERAELALYPDQEAEEMAVISAARGMAPNDARRAAGAMMRSTSRKL